MKGYAIFFDQESAERILAVRKKLEKHTQLFKPFNEEIDPHITLNYSEEMNFEETDKSVKKYTEQNLPFELKFCSIGIFPNQEHNVIFLNPQPNIILYNLYNLIRDLTIKQKTVNDHDLFDAWVPHCTLTTKFEEENYAEFIKEIQSELKLSIDNPLRVKVSKCLKYEADIENKKIELVEL